MFEEAAITLRRLYGEGASVCLEARATERLAEMMLDADQAERAYGKIIRRFDSKTDKKTRFGLLHPFFSCTQHYGQNRFLNGSKSISRLQLCSHYCGQKMAEWRAEMMLHTDRAERAFGDKEGAFRLV